MAPMGEVGGRFKRRQAAWLNDPWKATRGLGAKYFDTQPIIHEFAEPVERKGPASLSACISWLAEMRVRLLYSQ